MKIQARLVLGILGLLLIVLGYALTRTIATGKLGLVFAPATPQLLGATRNPVHEPSELDERYMATPSLSPSLSPEERQKQILQLVQERHQRARKLYNDPSYLVAFEFANPLFQRAFPDAHMYAVWVNAGMFTSHRSYKTMVSRGDKDYIMPGHFNQLMLDAGYKLDKATRDKLVQALVIAILPTEMALSSVTCSKGREIDIREGDDLSSHYTYEIECRIIDAPTRFRFRPFDEQFGGGVMFLRSVTGEEVGFGFRTGQVVPEK